MRVTACAQEKNDLTDFFSHLEAEKSDDARDLNDQTEHPFSKNVSPPQETANSRHTEVLQPTQNTVEESKRVDERDTNRTKIDSLVRNFYTCNIVVP